MDIYFNPFKLKELADDNFKFDKYGIKSSKRVENAVGKGEITRKQQFQIDENVGKFSEKIENAGEKGEIACYEQFLLFPQCFQQTYTAGT